MSGHCPDCGSENLTKNGTKWATVDGQRVKIQQRQCQACGRMTGYPVDTLGNQLPAEVVFPVPSQ